MDDVRPCETYLIYYVPNVVTGASVVIGVVLAEVTDEPGSFADVRFLKQWNHVKAMFPTVDIGLLQAFELEFRRLLTAQDRAVFNYRGPLLPRRWLLGLALDSFSNSIVFSDAMVLMADEPRAELDKLANIYLQPPPGDERRGWDLTTRRGIKREMENQLRQANLLKIMRKDISASKYIGAGSRLRIDFGYKPNDVIHLLHAQHLVDAEPEITQLIHVYPLLREGIEREEHAMSTLTLVTENITESQNEEVAYSLSLLKEFEGQGLDVIPVGKFNAVVEAARQDMRV